MADVDRGRGQLIVVTGLLVAVAVVGLVLVLNTAIYTENLASRGTDQSSREAVEYRATVVDATGGLVEAENRADHGSYGTVESDVEDGVARVDNLTARSYAAGGTVVRINQTTESMAFSEGALVRQTDGAREFRDDSGTHTDWTVATDVEDARAVRLTVARADLATDPDDAVALQLDRGLDRWETVIYRDGGSNVSVATSVDGAAPVEVCSVAGTNVTVDLTSGTVAGEPCPGLDWAEGLGSPYDVRIRNGGNATGTYELTIGLEGAAAVDGGNVSAGPSDTVYHVPAVYAVSFDIHFETSSLEYRAEVRVAPGEPG